MKKYIKNIGFLFLSIFMFSCVDEIELDLPEGEVGLVVDGMVTTKDGPQKITLSETDNFNNEGQTPRVTGAVVKVIDDLGNVFDFQENEDGEYLSAESFKGIVGRSYYVEIERDGKSYRSNKELLQKVPEIENLRYFFVEGSLIQEEGYYAYFDFQENPDEENAYRIIQANNDTIENQPSDIITFDDEFFNGQYLDSLSFSRTLKEDDKYKIELWSLSNEASSFLSEVEDQASGTGGPFDVPPAPIYGNVFNVDDPNELVWGYFSVSDIDADSLVVNP